MHDFNTFTEVFISYLLEFARVASASVPGEMWKMQVQHKIVSARY